MEIFSLLSSYSILHLAFFLFIITITINNLLLKLHRPRLPPGPSCLPIIGNLHHLKRPLHHTLKSLSQKYGHVISLRFGSRLVVVVSSASAAEECFTKNDVILANRPRFLSGKYVLYDSTTLGSSSYGDHWRNLRRITTLHVLSTQRINNLYSSQIRRDEIMTLVRNLAAGHHHDDDDFSQVELSSKFYEMTFNNIMKMISGENHHHDVEEGKQFRAAVTEFLQDYGPSNVNDFLPILRVVDFGGLKKRIRNIGEKTDRFLKGVIEEHRRKKKEEGEENMIDHLLTLQQSQPDCYPDHIIKGLVLNMFLAGTDTSAVTLEWAMSCLLNHEDVMKKAQDEMEKHVGQDRLLEESDLPKLSYLKNIIYETLRLYTPGPLLLPHLSSDDCTIGGYRVPRDTIVLTNAWHMNRDPQTWCDATCFKPERFEKEGELEKLIVFGKGRRACPGEALALRTISFTLGILIQCFDWKRIGDKEIDMREKIGFMLSRLVSLKAMCKPRPLIVDYLMEK
ncbi:isoflavone 2'-hydroxylase-like [Arachis duranensis]|uniref:Isoflavone 2'-hydroxylase-like n=1 Tax=Arachis duranensis TaxID=130453 RepID=A0A6P4D2M1_ARADU|nr:isoflavone 2'-hydroxylase-like [Arachis duranensis]